MTQYIEQGSRTPMETITRLTESIREAILRNGGEIDIKALFDQLVKTQSTDSPTIEDFQRAIGEAFSSNIVGFGATSNNIRLLELSDNR